jgi:hypothetical protein
VSTAPALYVPLRETWNSFVRFAESTASLGVKNAIARAAVFEFRPDAVDQAYEKAKDPNQDHSFLAPFDDIAMVDQRGVVLWHRIDREGGTTEEAAEPAPFRLSCRMIVYSHYGDDSGTPMGSGRFEGFWLEGESKIGESKIRDGALSTQWFHRVDYSSLRIKVNDGFLTGEAAMEVLKIDADALKRMVDHDFVEAAQASLDQLAYATQPSHYLIEERPAGSRTPQWRKARGTIVDQTGKKDRRQLIPRLDERPKIRYIRPDQVVSVRPDTSGKDRDYHPARKPHQRAGSVRILRSPRYRNMRGKAIYVKPHWVGDREWDVGRLHYRVIA